MVSNKLTKDQITAASKARPRLVPVSVPAWGGEVFCRRLGGMFYYALLAKWRADNVTDEQRSIRFLMQCLVDADGKPMFAGDDDEAFLAFEGVDVIDPLLAECQRINGLAGEAKKNSPTPDAGSSTKSDSPRE